jgi:hypothetical protein
VSSTGAAMSARYPCEASGDVAEWLRSGLQSRLHRFDSGRRLMSEALRYELADNLVARITNHRDIDAGPGAAERLTESRG